MSAQVSEAVRLYARLAPTYDDETRYITGIRLAAIKALNLAPGENVLDAGCGTGWCLPKLATLVGRSGTVQGFEPSPEMLSLARSRIRQHGLTRVFLQHACGDTARMEERPDAILFSYTHDLIRTRTSLQNIFSQAGSGTRIVSTGTKLFPNWFFPGNAYLRHTHRATITSFEGFENPWTILSEFCSSHEVSSRLPGSRYLFVGVLR